MVFGCGKTAAKDGIVDQSKVVFVKSDTDENGTGDIRL